MDLTSTMKLQATMLHGQIYPKSDLEPRVLRVTTNGDSPDPFNHVLLTESQEYPEGFGFYLHSKAQPSHSRAFALPESINYLRDGDVVRINPRQGYIWVMYRRESRSNSIFLTERCNSWCVMCSQPPRAHDDSYLVEDWLSAIPMMDQDTSELGISGGEPTLLKDRFLAIVSKCRECLPSTGLHVLSNGRMFSYLSYAFELSKIGHSDLMIGIPLYSDVAWRHDWVVQSPGAFDQTVRGIMNLARCGVKIEIRVVLQSQTVDRLPELARYISRNFPFVSHVALMGLEPIGFGKTNIDAIWADPVDYMPKLSHAVQELSNYNICVSIYNHQLCTLNRNLWQYSRKSISDWKNIFVASCQLCDVQDQCCGFFHSASTKHSRGISPIAEHR